MSFIKWLRGCNTDASLKFENDKLKKEIATLHAKQEESWVREAKNAQRRDSLLEDIERLRKELNKDVSAYIQMKESKEVLEKEIKQKDSQMASFAEEIIRLKKLIEQNRDRGTAPVAPAPANAPDAKDYTKSPPVHTTSSGMQMTDSLKKIIEQAKAKRDEANKMRNDRPKGKGNDRTGKH